MLHSDQLIHAIALTQLYGSKCLQLRQMLAAYPAPQEAWERSSLPGKQLAMERAQKEMEFILRHNIRTFYLYDEDYPIRLAACQDAPVVLYAMGNVNLQDGHFISVVGTRQATERGKIITRDMVLGLADKVPGLTVVSGLAYGIDITAHRAAMEAGIPTLIIPAHGLDRIYPQTHRNDAVRALSNGGVVTEYMTETEPERHNFVSRNRIIAGLSECTLVVESRERGGSLITASLAFGYGRQVFAVPGRISDTTSSGCNRLIQDEQAALVQTADDVIRAMGWVRRGTPIQTYMAELSQQEAEPSQKGDSPISSAEQNILRLIQASEDGVTANDLAEQTQQPYADIITLLIGLEMQKRVKSTPGGTYLAL